MKRRQAEPDRLMFLMIDYPDIDSAVIDDVATLIRTIDEDPVLSRLPVHWHLPALAFDPPLPSAWLSMVSRLRTRVALGIDLVVPAGYSSIPHAALLPCDVELDLRWAIDAPSTDVRRDIHPNGPIFVYPPFPDVQRRSIEEAYVESGCFVLVSRGAYGELIGTSEAGIPVSMIDYSAIHPKRPERLVMKAPVVESVAVVVSGRAVHEEIRNGSFGRIVERLRERAGYRFALLTELCSREHTHQVTINSTGPPSPAARRFTRSEWDRIARCSYSRDELNQAARSTRNRARNRRCLGETEADRGFARRTAPAHSDSHQGTERVLVSDMTGDVTMAGDTISANFEQGRLVEVAGSGTGIVIGLESTSRLQIDGLTKGFELESAFSFEEEGARGLKERFSCDTGYFVDPVLLEIDFMFIDLAEQLFIALRTIFPESQRDGEFEALHPFDIGITTPDDAITITGRYPDGETVARTIRTPVRLDYVWGTSFVIGLPDADLLLFTPERQYTTISCIPITATRTRRRLRLDLGLGGIVASGSVREISGTIHESLFGLDIAGPATCRPPILATAATERLEKSYPSVVRETRSNKR